MFFGRVDESLWLLVEEARHTNTLLFNLGADIAENTKLVGDVKNLLFKICQSQGLMGELPGESESWRGRRCQSGRRGLAGRGWGQRLQSLRAL